MDDLKDINPEENVKKETISTNTNELINNNDIQPIAPSTKANLEPSATVKFVLMPFGQVVTLARPLKTTIGAFILQFSNDLKIAADYLQVVHSVTSKLTIKMSNNNF